MTEAAAPIAALPMYDWPELHPATDAFWSAVAAALAERGLAAPAALDREKRLVQILPDPALLLTQACGADLVDELDERVTLIGAPVYAARGCEAGRYSSWIVVRRGDEPDRVEDLRRRVAAVNGFGSFSGWWTLLADGPAPPKTHLTGSHRLSAQAVAEGAADFASIDVIAYAHLERFDPDIADQLAIVSRTRLAPAPPFVTAIAHVDQAALFRDALKTAIARAPDAAAALLLEDVVSVDPTVYREIAALEPPRSVDG